MRNGTHCYIDNEFKKNCDKLFPYERSIRAKTAKLNKILEEIIYGKKK